MATPSHPRSLRDDDVHVVLDVRPLRDDVGVGDKWEPLGAGGGVERAGAGRPPRGLRETAAGARPALNSYRGGGRREGPAAWRSSFGSPEGSVGGGSDSESDCGSSDGGESVGSTDSSPRGGHAAAPDLEAEAAEDDSAARPRTHAEYLRAQRHEWLLSAGDKDEIVLGGATRRGRARVSKVDLMKDSRNLRFRELFHAPDMWVNLLVIAAVIALIVLGVAEVGPFSRAPRRV